MASNNFRPFKVDGIDYIFNYPEFKQRFNLKATMYEKKEILYEQLADWACRSIDTVKGWYKGYFGPADLDTVKKVEAFFDAPADSFLTPLKKPTEKTELEENEMCEIKDYERDTARKVYTEMCDMIDGLEYFPEELTRGTAGLIGGTAQGFKYLGKEAFPFMYRDNLIQNVRKAGFDLPKRTRDQLIDFIFEAFGDGCSDTGMMYFESQAYKDYLEKNEFENSDDTRELYSVLYIKQLYEKLDAIFADYLRE